MNVGRCQGEQGRKQQEPVPKIHCSPTAADVGERRSAWSPLTRSANDAQNGVVTPSSWLTARPWGRGQLDPHNLGWQSQRGPLSGIKGRSLIQFCKEPGFLWCCDCPLDLVSGVIREGHPFRGEPTKTLF